MNNERLKTSQSETGGTSGEQGRVGGFEMPGCCGPETAETVQSCPCGSFLKGHRLAAFAVFSLIALMFLISQVGGILGIIAFFRTM